MRSRFKLSEQGHFSWKEWASALADVLKAAADRDEPDDGSHYYHHWLAALERLVMANGLIDRAAFWRSTRKPGGNILPTATAQAGELLNYR